MMTMTTIWCPMICASQLTWSEADKRNNCMNTKWWQQQLLNNGKNENRICPFIVYSVNILKTTYFIGQCRALHIFTYMVSRQKDDGSIFSWLVIVICLVTYNNNSEIMLAWQHRLSYYCPCTNPVSITCTTPGGGGEQKACPDYKKVIPYIVLFHVFTLYTSYSI